MLEFNILKGQYLNRLDKNVVSADTTDLKAQFELTADFAGTITVWWRRSDVSNTYTSTLAADGTCTIPAEALAATDKAVYGPYDHDVFVSISDTGRTTTSEYKLTVQRSAFSTDATPGTGGSPTAYEELVEQFDELKADNQTFKDNMTEQQETFESTVTENVDNIRYVVETETAPPIIEEASGAEITLDDSAYRQVRGLQLYGYSKQVQTTGAQLIPITEENVKGTNGLTATLNPDGSVKITGMPTARYARALDTNVSLSPGTYHISGGSNAAGYVVAQVHIVRSAEDLWFTNTSFEVQNGDNVIVDVLYNSATLQAVDISSFKPMLNAGSSPLPWEPYSGGVASPSPDWAQPIHSVADEVNLLNEELYNPDTKEAQYVPIRTDAESVTASTNLPLQSTNSAFIMLVPGNVSSYDGFSTASNGVYNGRNRTITPDDGYVTLCYIFKNDTSGIKVQDYWVMVNAGDTALPYRPYGHNVTVESAGANLFDVSKMLNDPEFEAEQNGEYTIFKAITSGAGVYFYARVPIDGAKDGSKYTISRNNISMVGAYFGLENLNADGNVLNPRDPNSTVKEKLSGATLFMTTNPFGIGNTAVQNGQVAMAKDIIVNRGSTPIPWQPYVAPSSALIALTDSLRGIPVDSGGTYTDGDGQQWIADYIYRRQTDGKWMLWRNIKKGELLSSFSWSVNIGGDRLYYVDNDLSSASGTKIISNYFKSGVWGNDNPTTICLGNALQPVLGVSTLDFPNVDTLKTWLNKKRSEGNPCYFIAPLATPTVEELPDDVQTELNGLYTYNLHTDMWNGDGAYMGLKYVADTKTWINNKIAGLSTAMIENL